MTNFIFEPQAIAGLPIVGTDSQFPVRRIYCVGRNYAAHAREMGFDPDREPPFFFCKPNDEQSVVPVPPGVTATATLSMSLCARQPPLRAPKATRPS